MGTLYREPIVEATLTVIGYLSQQRLDSLRAELVKAYLPHAWVVNGNPRWLTVDYRDYEPSFNNSLVKLRLGLGELNVTSTQEAAFEEMVRQTFCKLATAMDEDDMRYDLYVSVSYRSTEMVFYRR